MEKLRFVTYLAPSVRPVYELVARAAGERLGIETELVDGTSCERFASGEGDVAFICGLPYVELATGSEPPFELLAAPVLSGARYEGRPIYFSDVIVHADSDVHSFQELRGRVWSFNEPHSHSGYSVTRAHLARIGEPRAFFKLVVEAGFHQRSIELVRSRTVDGSAIDSQVLEIAMRDDPSLRNELRIVETLGPSTIQPVVASTALPSSLRRDLRGILLDLGHTPEERAALDRGLVAGFEMVEDADYDDIRAMVAEADAAGVEWC
jgi:ABC-type phosphate/phosphonate transport system substrate-binding protein